MSDQVNDTTEFMQAVGSQAVPSNARNKRRNSLKGDDAEDILSKPGLPCQYTVYGAGYLPVTATRATLPPGSYKIEETQSGLIFVPMSLVTDAILRLPDSKSAYVISEVQKFWERKARFEASGTIYKMGIMMYGPPGSGKTMTVNIIMEEMIKLGGLVIVADRPSQVTDALQNFRKVEPDRPLVVVLEDIDAIIERYGEPEMLSLLDGENQIKNVVYVATTNYPERIDARFMDRPARFDYIIKVDMPNEEARKMYLEFKKAPLVVKETVKQLSKKTVQNNGGEDVVLDVETDVEIEVDLVAGTNGLSIAHIREVYRAIFLMDHSPSATIKRVKGMRVLPKSGSQNKVGIGQ